MIDEKFIFRGSLGQEKFGHSGFREYAEYIHASLSEYRCHIEELVVQSNKVFAKMVISGIHNFHFMGYSPTNNKVSWAGAALFTFPGSKIASLWVLGDLKALEQQLGNKI